MKNFNITDTVLPFYYPYDAGGLYANGGSYYDDQGNIHYDDGGEFKKGGIYIKPSKRGTFTAAASRHGQSVQGFASQVLANKGNYSPAMVKKANFARNASHWHHEDGGPVYDYGGDVDPYADMYNSADVYGNPPPLTPQEKAALLAKYANKQAGLRDMQKEFGQRVGNKKLTPEELEEKFMYKNMLGAYGDSTRMVNSGLSLDKLRRNDIRYTRQMQNKESNSVDPTAGQKYSEMAPAGARSFGNMTNCFGEERCLGSNPVQTRANGGSYYDDEGNIHYANGGAYYDDQGNIHYEDGGIYKSGGGIHINPANKGKFTATKKRTGKSTEELTHSSNPLTRKRAIFAQNARKWHHEFGGNVYDEGGEISEEDQMRKQVSEQLENENPHNVIKGLIQGGMDRETAISLVEDLRANPYQEEEHEPQEDIQNELTNSEEPEQEGEIEPEQEGEEEPEMMYGGSYSHPLDAYPYGGGYYSGQGYPYKTVVANSMIPNVKGLNFLKQGLAGVGLATGVLGAGLGYSQLFSGGKDNKVSEGLAGGMDALMGYQRPLKGTNPYKNYFHNASIQSENMPKTATNFKAKTPQELINEGKPGVGTWEDKMRKKYLQPQNTAWNEFGRTGPAGPEAPSRFGTPQTSRFTPLGGAPGATATPSNQVYDIYGKPQNDLWGRYKDQTATPQQVQESNYDEYMGQQEYGGELNTYQFRGQVRNDNDPYAPITFPPAYNAGQNAPEPFLFGQGAFDYARGVNKPVNQFQNQVPFPQAPGTGGDMLDKYPNANTSRNQVLSNAPFQDIYSGDALKVKRDNLMADIRKNDNAINTPGMRRRNYGSYAATANIGLGMAASNYADLDAQKYYNEYLKDRRLRNNIDAGYAYNPVNPRGNYTMNVALGDWLKPGSQTVATDTGTTGMARYGGTPKYKAGGEYQVSEEQLLQLMRDGAEVEFL